jgi:hypothetical protein
MTSASLQRSIYSAIRQKMILLFRLATLREMITHIPKWKAPQVEFDGSPAELFLGGLHGGGFNL